jgi:allophanate hydrolase subunit 2
VPSHKSNIVRVLKGPQFDYFSEKSKKEFFSKNYKITNLTDRMGMRLEGLIIKNIVNTNIRSEGITKGAIQVPADGQPIILLTDHPTIGGYPKIANVISADYDLLIQKIPGEKISFKCVELQEAEKIYKEYFTNISKIIKDIKEIN